MHRRDFAALTRIPRTAAKTSHILHSHTCRRVRERYGLQLSYDDLARLERRISEGYRQSERDDSVTCLARQSGNRTVWSVRAYGREMFFIYDRKRQAFSTCLTREMVARNFPDAALPLEASNNEGEISL